jgi:hypothetical protein
LLTLIDPDANGSLKVTLTLDGGVVTVEPLLGDEVTGAKTTAEAGDTATVSAARRIAVKSARRRGQP